MRHPAKRSVSIGITQLLTPIDLTKPASTKASIFYQMTWWGGDVMSQLGLSQLMQGRIQWTRYKSM